MPKMFIHAPAGTFDQAARAQVAAALTDLGLACEKLPDVPTIRQGVWVFFAEHAPGAVFSGGRVAPGDVTALVVYALQGGLDERSKDRLIGSATAILGEHARDAADPPPVYVVVHEIPEARWGMFGRTVELAKMRAAT